MVVERTQGSYATAEGRGKVVAGPAGLVTGTSPVAHLTPTIGETMRGTDGFTLTEVLISVVVIVIGVLGFASSIGVVTMQMQYGERNTEVALVAADQLERLRALPYDSVTSGSRTIGDYDVDWDVSGQDPKRVLLTLSFEKRNGDTAADTLVAYVPR